MSVEKKVHFNGEAEEIHSRIALETSKVDLNNLMKKIREEEKKTKRSNLVISVAALSVATVFGIILTL